MLNRCEFIGHVCANPEVKNLEGGVKVATFSIGITKRGYTMQNGTTIPDKTTFVNIVAWRGLADICEKYVQKGGQLFIAGELSIRQYEKDGSKRIAAEVIAENIELLGRKPESVSAEKQTNNVHVENDDKDDLPFSSGSR